jgi:tetratricopeptide (TPR) repeat protein
MEEYNYGSGVRSYSMSGDEALGFLDGLQGQMGARDLVNEGGRLFLAGDFTGAESKFKEAIALNPQNAVAHGNIGNICFKTGKYKEAIPWLEKALQLDPQLAGASDCLRECRSRSLQWSQTPQKSAKQPLHQSTAQKKPWWQFWK